MAAGNFIPYDEFVFRFARQEFNFLNGTIEALLLDNAYTPDTAAHTVLGDVTGQEITDTDYARQTLANNTITQDGSGRTVFDADDVDFGNAVSIAARYMVIVLNTGVASTSYLMGYVDLNDGGTGNVSSTNSDFDVAFSANGIHRIDP